MFLVENRAMAHAQNITSYQMVSKQLLMFTNHKLLFLYFIANRTLKQAVLYVLHAKPNKVSFLGFSLVQNTVHCDVSLLSSIVFSQLHKGRSITYSFTLMAEHIDT